jgi:hypothetical protein
MIGHRQSPSLARIIAGLSGFFTLKWARPKGRAQPLRHDTFEPHDASMPEYGRAVLVGVPTQHDSDPSLADQLGKSFLSVHEGKRSQVIAVEFEQVEGVQHRLADDAAPVQRVEDGDAVRAADDSLAVDGERLGP